MNILDFGGELDEGFREIHWLRDVKEIRALTRRLDWDVTYTQLTPGGLDSEACEIHVDECLVFREHYGCHIVAQGTSTPNGYGVMTVQSGVGRFFGEEISANKLVLFPPQSTIDAVGLPGVRTVVFVLPKERVETAAEDWGVELLKARRVLVVEPGVDRLQHLKAALTDVEMILEQEVTSKWESVEQDLIATVVGLFDSHAFPGGSRFDPAAEASAGASYAIEARSHVCGSTPDQVDLPSLASRLGITRHHLNRCFRQHYGVSLHRFVRLCRLNQARGLLMTRAGDLNVTDAAYACGFNHLGRFSTAYRDLFGEAPSDTLRLSTASS